MSRYVLMITQNAFPNGDAGAVRDLSFAKIYMELGYEVYMICQTKEVRVGEFQGIRFVSMHQEVHNSLEQAIRYYGYSNRLKKVIASLEAKAGIPYIIHLYDAPLNGVKYIKKYAARNKIRLIHDSVEWYSPCEFEKGKFDKAYVLKDKLNTKLIDSSFSVIAISTYLENYFANKGLNAIRVPVIMDMESGTTEVKRNGGLINITYAGSPAKKDLLSNMVQAFSELDLETRSKLHFNIVGVSKEQLIEKRLCSEQQLQKIDENITVYGRVPRDRVLEVLRESTDFSVLVRPANERYAKAGFPTKSVEAMMNSVAMFCNLTSDLGMYLHDGENAIIIEDETVEPLKKGFVRLSKLSNEEIIQLRRKARKTAERAFDYRQYVDKIKEFL